MPNKQATFNMVCEHLIRQGSQSRHAVFGCAYRGQDGLRCAIGALLPDEAYSFELEGQSAQRGTVAEILQRLEHDLQLCRELQLIHDRIPVEHWPKALEKVAYRHSLDLPVLLQKKLLGEDQIRTDLNDSASMSSPVATADEDIQMVSSLPNISQAIAQSQVSEETNEVPEIDLQVFDHPDEPLDAIDLADNDDFPSNQ